MVDQGGNVGINGLVERLEWLSGLASLAERDKLSVARAEVVPGHKRLRSAVALREVRGGQRHDEPQHAPTHRGMGFDEGHGADGFAESHGFVLEPKAGCGTA